MMTPSQLKEYEFKTAGRNAYKADDVDDFFAEVAANYTKMFHENGELVRRVGLLADRLEKFKKEEEEIKSAVVSAQRAADIIVRDAKNSVADAENEAQAVLAAAKSEADLIKSDAEKQAIADSELLLSMTRDKAQDIIRKAKEEAQSILLEANSTAKDRMGAATRTMTSESLHYDMLKKEVAQFKSDILSQYKAHIELISKLPDIADEEAKKIEIEAKQEEPEQVVLPEISDDTKIFTQEDVKDEVLELRAEVNAIKEEVKEEIKDNPQEAVNSLTFTKEPDVFEIDSQVEANLEDLVEEKIEINIPESDGLSATDFAEQEDIKITKEQWEEEERKAALEYFSSENKNDLMEVDEEMLTQDGELVVKTDLPLSFFDETDSLEFVDDFDGMEKDEDVGAFSFSSVQPNAGARKRPSNRVTVDSAYLDFLASENDEDANKVEIIEEDDDDNDDSDESPKRGFFRRR